MITNVLPPFLWFTVYIVENNTQTKNLNNLTIQNVRTQYPIPFANNMFFKSLHTVFSECYNFVRNFSRVGPEKVSK